MNETAINWTEFSWNPWSGCELVSPECTFCYARTLAENRRGTAAFPNGFDLTFRKPKKLNEPANLLRKLGRGALIFTNSMTDLFLAEVPDAKIHEVLDVMEAVPEHRYQVLTKRAHRAKLFFRKRKPPPSLWMGVTCGVRGSRWRVDALREIDATVRFVSAEPLLEQLDLDLTGIDWLITGGESGSHLSDPKLSAERSLARKATAAERRQAGEGSTPWVVREDRAPWVRSLVAAARSIGCAPWHKQWGGPTPASSGRLLDGELVNEFPSGPGVMPDASSRGQRSLPLLASGKKGTNE